MRKSMRHRLFASCNCCTEPQPFSATGISRRELLAGADNGAGPGTARSARVFEDDVGAGRRCTGKGSAQAPEHFAARRFEGRFAEVDTRALQTQ